MHKTQGSFVRGPRNPRNFCRGGTKPKGVLCGVGMCRGLEYGLPHPMGDSKPKRKINRAEKDRRARQAASLKKTLATREARARMSAAGKKSWEEDPERHKRASAATKKSWEVQGTRTRRIRGIKKAWTPERREAQSGATKRIMADPELNARRIAGLKRVSTDPELKALRIANLKKANADPATRRRKIKKMKQTLYTPEMNARRSAKLKKMHADARTGLAALKETERAENRRGGRPTKDVYKEAAILRERGATWRELARKFDPHFDKDPEAAMHRMETSVRRVMKSKKQEAPL